MLDATPRYYLSPLILHTKVSLSHLRLHRIRNLHLLNFRLYVGHAFTSSLGPEDFLGVQGRIRLNSIQLGLLLFNVVTQIVNHAVLHLPSIVRCRGVNRIHLYMSPAHEGLLLLLGLRNINRFMLSLNFDVLNFHHTIVVRLNAMMTVYASFVSPRHDRCTKSSLGGDFLLPNVMRQRSRVVTISATLALNKLPIEVEVICLLGIKLLLLLLLFLSFCLGRFFYACKPLGCNRSKIRFGIEAEASIWNWPNRFTSSLGLRGDLRIIDVDSLLSLLSKLGHSLVS